jgi:hypothetical protein
MSSFIIVGLQNSEQLPRAVREELEQIIAAIQQYASQIIPIGNIPIEDITIDASQIVSGILARERGGTGINTAGGTDGQLIIARTGLVPVLATLTPDTGIVITNGPGTITIGISGGGSHIHGIMRILGDGATTTFDLVDFAEMLEHVGVGGSFQDPTTFALSADGGQIVFTTAPSAAAVITLEYLIAGL